MTERGPKNLASTGPLRSARRIRRERTAGYALVGVFVVLALLMTTLLITLDETGEGAKDAGRARHRDLVHAATSQGLRSALNGLSSMDTAAVMGVTPTSHDIFEHWGAATELTNELYPPAGAPHAQEMQVRTGLVPGQRTRPPEGEDVRSAYSYIMNVQVSVRMNTPGIGAAEARTEIGVRIPQTYAHSN